MKGRTSLKQLFVRKASAPDSKKLSVLVNQAFRGEFSRQGWTTEADFLDGQRTDPELILEMIEGADTAILVFESDGKMVGSVFLKNKASHAYMGMFSVRPDLQNAGLGKKMLAIAEEWIRSEWRKQSVEIQVIQKRLELIAWYERRGYVKTGRRAPFPYGQPRLGLPKVSDLEFTILKKGL